MDSNDTKNTAPAAVASAAVQAAALAFRLFTRATVLLADEAARRPRIALAVAIAALLVMAGSAASRAKTAAAQRAAAAANADAARRQADAYRRYQDSQYVKYMGPITGPMYSSKW